MLWLPAVLLSGHDLVELLVLLDHAQFTAGPLLDRLQALAEIVHLGLQFTVALGQLLVFARLLLDPRGQALDIPVTAFAKPHLKLQQNDNDDQDSQQGFHP